MKKIFLGLLIISMLFSTMMGFCDEVGDSNVAVNTNMAIDNVLTDEVALHAWYNSDSGSLVDQAKFYCNGALFATVIAGGDNNWTTDIVSKTGLAQGTNYTFTVRFYLYPYNGTWINSAGNAWVTSGYSDTISATTDSSTPPTAITSLTKIAGINNMALSWVGGTGATKYEIYVDGSYVDETTSHSYNVTGLYESTSYTFEVVAVNSAGSTSRLITASTLAPAPPANITGLTGTPDYNSMYLSWGGAAGADYFEIYVNGTYVDSTSSFNYDVTGLPEGTTYTYQIVAVNSYGTKTSSITATTLNHRPANFTGFLNLTDNLVTRPVLASDWNSFCNRVNDFRAYKGLNATAFTYVTANVTDVSADIYNEVRNSLNSLSAYFTGGYTIPAAKVANVSDRKPSDFTSLKNALNSII